MREGMWVNRTPQRGLPVCINASGGTMRPLLPWLFWALNMKAFYQGTGNSLVRHYLQIVPKAICEDHSNMLKAPIGYCLELLLEMLLARR